MNPLSEFDARLRGEYPVVCGVDEAGRGPLAGRVYAAACVLPEGEPIEGLNDSKKLSAPRRDKLYDLIIERAADFAVAFADEKEIDELNILEASMLAMRRAAAQLTLTPDIFLVDGNRHPRIPALCRPIIGGDGKSASIAAASILAKVSRDRYMEAMDKLYPDYGFAKHKGYPTADHYAALAAFGPCPIHRTTFLKNLGEKHPEVNRGKAGEDAAAKYLGGLGWTVLERNFRVFEGELDIVAADGESVVFVEVKQRKAGGASRPADAVGRAKRERLKKAALAWLEKSGRTEDFRFDVLEIDGGTVNLIKNAF